MALGTANVGIYSLRKVKRGRKLFYKFLIEIKKETLTTLDESNAAPFSHSTLKNGLDIKMRKRPRFSTSK